MAVLRLSYWLKETARQEAMARANLGARQQAMAEQAQAAQLGGMLQAAGYQPQQQALIYAVRLVRFLLGLLMLVVELVLSCLHS